LLLENHIVVNLLIKGSTNVHFSTQSLLLNFQVNSYTTIDMHIDYVILSLFRKPKWAEL